MKNKSFILFRRIFSIILSIATIISGILLINGCLSIYNSGDHPYSREAVETAFSKIDIPIYITLALIVISIVLEFISPLNLVSGVQIDNANKLKLLLKKRRTDECDSAVASLINKERNFRKITLLAQVFLVFCASVVFITYSVNGNNFDDTDINGSVIKAVLVMAACFIIPLVYSIVMIFINNASIKREIEAVKKIPVSSNNAVNVKSHDKIINASKIVIIAAALIIIVYGFIIGGTADVLTKAINICTECIGLG